MAIVKRKELNEMKLEDVKKRLAELKLELSKNRAQIAVGGSAQNPGRVKELRRTIARMLTRINSKKEMKISKEKTSGGSKTG